MSVSANLGFDRSSRLAAYAGYVVLRAHQCTLVIADPPIFIADSQWVFVPIVVPIGAAVWPSILDMGCCAHVCARSACMDVHSLSPTPYLHRRVLMGACANFWPDRSSRLAAYTGQHNTEQRPF
jgi:hypothetical protein